METTVVYRQSWRQVFPVVLLTAAGIAGAAVAMGTSALGGGLGAVIGVVLGLRHGRTTLTPGALVVRRLRARAIPWTEIDEVGRRRVLGTHGVFVRRRGTERRIPLAAPQHTTVLAPDPEFEEKAATIERRWREARGAAR